MANNRKTKMLDIKEGFLKLPGISKQLPKESICPVPHVGVIGRRFSIVPMKDAEDPENDGRTYMQQQLIQYRPHEGISHTKDTVLHEILHAIDESLGCGMTEAQVAVMTTGIIAVLKTNPELTSWILKEDSNEK